MSDIVEIFPYVHQNPEAMASALPFSHSYISSLSSSTTERWVGFLSHSVSCLRCFSIPVNPVSPRSIPVTASSSSENNSATRTQKARVKEDSKERNKQPSVAEIQSALGVGKSSNNSKFRRKESRGFLDSFELEPFGEEEGTFERKLRDAGEWIIEKTERGERSGQESMMLFLLKLLPVWCLCLLLASGVIKLPFPVPFLDKYM